MADTRLATYASFIKIEHTLLSLPLIFSGLLLHTHGWPGERLAGLLLLAAVGARVVAMGLNRIIDAEIDAANPRTQRRELARGAMRRREAWAIVLLGGAVYLVSAWVIAPICFWLSPIPILLFAIYPYLKRFTALAHLGLGLAWSMGPMAGWLVAAKTLQGMSEVVWLWLFSVLWVAGFDIIYATMDEGFDRQARLHSLPVALGKLRALAVARVLHAAAFFTLVLLWNSQLYSPIAFRWLLGVGALFIWQHAIAERNPGFAFFQLNGALGFFVLGMVISGIR